MNPYTAAINPPKTKALYTGGLPFAQAMVLHTTLRYSFKILCWILALLLLLWISVWSYITLNKASIIKKVTSKVNDRVNGQVTIGDLDASFFRTFPFPSVQLSDVRIRDSMYSEHKHEFLIAKKLFVRIELKSLFTNNPEVGKVIVEKGSIYLFTDTAGRNNLYILKSKNASEAELKQSTPTYPDFTLKDMKVVFESQERNKFHYLDIKKLKAVVDNKKEYSFISMNTELLVHSLAFNTAKGSFVQNHSLKGKFELKINSGTKEIFVNSSNLKINNHPFSITAKFDPKSVMPEFNFFIETKQINYKVASAMVTPVIKQKLDSFNIERPFDLNVKVEGLMKQRNKSKVTAIMQVINNTVTSPIGTFNNCSFTGVFSNELNKNLPRTDDNSGLSFTKFTGTWESLPLKAGIIEITNLKDPFLTCDLKSEFPLTAVNDLTGSATMKFTQGSGKMDVLYKGPIGKNDSARKDASIFGNVSFEKAIIKYTPRNLSLTNCSGTLEFKDKDVLIHRLKASVGSSDLLMNGSVKNLVSLIDKNPELLVLDWNIFSPKINLSDFKPFLAKRAAVTVQTPASVKKGLLKTANQIDKMLKDGNVHLSLKAKEMFYKKFTADNVAADVVLMESKIILNNVSLNHAKGNVALSGSLREAGEFNNMLLQVNIIDVDIPKIFHSFDNFGQDAITDKNMRGTLSANVSIAGALTDKAEFSKEGLSGIIDFSVKNGELINFEPIQKISKSAFKNRNFSDIRFAELKNIIEVNGSAFKINHMEIRSTAFSLFVEGIYDAKKGTDMSIQVPLSNLKKRDADYEPVNKGRSGASIRLRAKTGEDGKLKISWDPFKKSLKNQKKELAIE